MTLLQHIIPPTWRR